MAAVLLEHLAFVERSASKEIHFCCSVDSLETLTSITISRLIGYRKESLPLEELSSYSNILTKIYTRAAPFARPILKVEDTKLFLIGEGLGLTQLAFTYSSVLNTQLYQTLLLLRSFRSGNDAAFQANETLEMLTCGLSPPVLGS